MRGSVGSGEGNLALAVAGVEDPRLFHTLGDLGLIRTLHPTRRTTEITVAVPRLGHSGREELAARIAAAVYPGEQGCPLPHVIAGKAVTFGLAATAALPLAAS